MVRVWANRERGKRGSEVRVDKEGQLCARIQEGKVVNE